MPLPSSFVKISQLATILTSSISSDDFLPIVDSGSLNTKKILVGDFANFISSSGNGESAFSISSSYASTASYTQYSFNSTTASYVIYSENSLSASYAASSSAPGLNTDILFNNNGVIYGTNGVFLYNPALSTVYLNGVLNITNGTITSSNIIANTITSSFLSASGYIYGSNIAIGNIAINPAIALNVNGVTKISSSLLLSGSMNLTGKVNTAITNSIGFVGTASYAVSASNSLSSSYSNSSSYAAISNASAIGQFVYLSSPVLVWYNNNTTTLVDLPFKNVPSGSGTFSGSNIVNSSLNNSGSYINSNPPANTWQSFNLSSTTIPQKISALIVEATAQTEWGDGSAAASFYVAAKDNILSTLSYYFVRSGTGYAGNAGQVAHCFGIYPVGLNGNFQWYMANLNNSYHNISIRLIGYIS